MKKYKSRFYFVDLDVIRNMLINMGMECVFLELGWPRGSLPYVRVQNNWVLKPVCPIPPVHRRMSTVVWRGGLFYVCICIGGVSLHMYTFIYIMLYINVEVQAGNAIPHARFPIFWVLDIM